jgi:hypothetical protein
MNMPCFPQGITVFGGNGSCPRIQINQEMFTMLGFQEINENKGYFKDTPNNLLPKNN